MKLRALSAGSSLRAIAFMLIGAVGLFSTFGASAAIRPAYTKNVDEAGRQPYNYNVEFSKFSCSLNCTNFVTIGSVILFDAPPVPAGKRLVVVSVSGELPSNNSYNSISFQSAPVISNQRALWQFHGPFYQILPGTGVWGMSSEAFFTVEPGVSPHIRVRLGDASNFITGITISGYLIDANN